MACILNKLTTGTDTGRYNQFPTVLEISLQTYTDFERHWRTVVGTRRDLCHAIESATGSLSVP